MANGTTICLTCCEPCQGGVTCDRCGRPSRGTDDGDVLTLPAGTVLHGRYLLGRVLGHGGFGVTYLARDGELDARVAIKEYLPRGEATRNRDGSTVRPRSPGERDSFVQGLESFLKEARALAQLRKEPNVVTVYDVFPANGTGYMVMEYLDGMTAEDLLRRNQGRLSEADALRIALPVLDALRASHARGIIHRDIKPANIYVTKEGPVFLLDFGEARYVTGAATRSVSAVLTEGFAPPEQYVRSTPQDWSVDVYAVGATLWRMMSGRIPPGALERQRGTSIPALRDLLGERVSLAVSNAVSRAMSLDPMDRFRSVRELQLALTGRAEPTEDRAREQSRREGDQQWRQPALYAAAGAAIVTVLGLGAMHFAGRAGEAPERPKQDVQAPQSASENAPGTLDPQGAAELERWLNDDPPGVGTNPGGQGGGAASSESGDERATSHVEENHMVRIVAIHPEDAFYGDRNELIGQTCVTVDRTTHKGDGWHAATLKCGSVSPYYYKVALKDLGLDPVAVPPLGKTPVSQAAVSAAAVAAAAAAEVAATATESNSSIGPGRAVSVLAIDPADAYYENRGDLVGKTCTTSIATTVRGRWHSGVLDCDGTGHTFYRVALTDRGLAAPARGGWRPSNSAAGGSVSQGSVSSRAGVASRAALEPIAPKRKVRILDIAKEDAYYHRKEEFLGRVCTTTRETRVFESPWHAGPVLCDDGESLHFYKVLLEVL